MDESVVFQFSPQYFDCFYVMFPGTLDSLLVSVECFDRFIFSTLISYVRAIFNFSVEIIHEKMRLGCLKKFGGKSQQWII